MDCGLNPTKGDFVDKFCPKKVKNEDLTGQKNVLASIFNGRKCVIFQTVSEIV